MLSNRFFRKKESRPDPLKNIVLKEIVIERDPLTSMVKEAFLNCVDYLDEKDFSQVMQLSKYFKNLLTKDSDRFKWQFLKMDVMSSAYRLKQSLDLAEFTPTDLRCDIGEIKGWIKYKFISKPGLVEIKVTRNDFRYKHKIITAVTDSKYYVSNYSRTTGIFVLCILLSMWGLYKSQYDKSILAGMVVFVAPITLGVMYELIRRTPSERKIEQQQCHINLCDLKNKVKSYMTFFKKIQNQTAKSKVVTVPRP